MAKITLSDVSNILGNPTSAANTINANNDLIEQTLERLVSRDGTSPNQMTADVDLNNNDIINVNNINADVLILDGKTVTPDELQTVPATVMMKATYDPELKQIPPMYPDDYDPEGKGVNVYESENMAFDPGLTDSIERSVRGKLRDVPVTIKDFGATGTGVVDTSAAFDAMASALGFVRFPRGAYLFPTKTVSVPLYFDEGAYITVSAGNTLTISNRIESIRQWIFRGDGDYRVNIITPNGEDARQLHVSWFGAFPTNTSNVTQTPMIQKAFDALSGQTREGTVFFDQGSYHVDASHTVFRGTHVVGLGIRRTVFDVSGTGYDVFVTNGEACRFSHLQFEQPSGSVSYRLGSLINLAHDTCEVEDVWLWPSEYGILVNGDNCSVRQIRGSYGVALDPSAVAVISVRKGGCTVDDVKIMSTTSAPPRIVRVSNGSANFGNIRVSNIMCNEATILVEIEANGSDINDVVIYGIEHTGSGSDISPSLVHIKTSSTHSVRNVSMSNLSGNALTTSLLHVEQGSSGVTEDIVIDASGLRGTTGSGVILAQTAGTLRRVTVGDSCNIRNRATPVSQSGTMTEIKVSPSAISGVHWSIGSGTPEAVITAPIGCIYSDTTGGKLYIKATGTGNTGWVVVGTQT